MALAAARAGAAIWENAPVTRLLTVEGRSIGRQRLFGSLLDARAYTGDIATELFIQRHLRRWRLNRRTARG